MTAKKKRNKLIDAKPHTLYTVRSTEEMSVFVLDATGEVHTLIGPNRSTDRVMVVKADSSFSVIDVVSDGHIEVSEKALPNPVETPDPIPIETAIDRPLTLKEEMMRYISSEIQRQVEGETKEEMESFEEADDFDVGEEEEWSSPYEMSEMQEEFVAEEEQTQKQEESPSLVDNETPSADQADEGGETGDNGGSAAVAG